MPLTLKPGEVGEVLIEEELPELPVDVYDLVAQKLPAEDLPSLRLVSKKWYTATNKAVRIFGRNGFFSQSQLEHLHTAVHKFPGLTA